VIDDPSLTFLFRLTEMEAAAAMNNQTNGYVSAATFCPVSQSRPLLLLAWFQVPLLELMDILALFVLLGSSDC
jgi:hypothetical protein